MFSNAAQASMYLQKLLTTFGWALHPLGEEAILQCYVIMEGRGTGTFSKGIKVLLQFFENSLQTPVTSAEC